MCVFRTDKWKTDKVKLYDNPVKIADAHFMEVRNTQANYFNLSRLTHIIFVFQPVIKLWLHDISQSMPNTAASAF